MAEDQPERPYQVLLGKGAVRDRSASPAAKQAGQQANPQRGQ
ncbi:hypothetical protein [Kribbella jejuensis]|uniref:Uncharacterized protein n=1 Tax=Kribbella jejuensis TaxID=236068 RepID=A0A542EQJ1_9ACTN|nr:hypothetical protein [Kribbella jejuensis]TQJ17620.1 hypothetical protein FB475_1744 [Kribbella jejuensis]